MFLDLPIELRQVIYLLCDFNTLVKLRCVSPLIKRDLTNNIVVWTHTICFEGSLPEETNILVNKVLNPLGSFCKSKLDYPTVYYKLRSISARRLSIDYYAFNPLIKCRSRYPCFTLEFSAKHSLVNKLSSRYPHLALKLTPKYPSVNELFGIQRVWIQDHSLLRRNPTVSSTHSYDTFHETQCLDYLICTLHELYQQ